MPAPSTICLVLQSGRSCSPGIRGWMRLEKGSRAVCRAPLTRFLPGRLLHGDQKQTWGRWRLPFQTSSPRQRGAVLLCFWEHSAGVEYDAMNFLKGIVLT